MQTRSALFVLVGFALGIATSQLPDAFADTAPSVADPSNKHFYVSIDEVQQNLVFSDEFTGRYVKTVELADGSRRTVELTPLLRNGRQVVELRDGDNLTYMDLNGTTTNGRLMVQLRDIDAMERNLRLEGQSDMADQLPGRAAAR